MLIGKHHSIGFIRKRIFTIAILCGCVLVNIASVYGQVANTTDELGNAQGQLNALDDELTRTNDQRDQIQEAIEQLDNDRAVLNERLIGLARTIQDIEANALSLERELTNIKLKEADLTQDLVLRRQSMSHVLAALQRMGQKPPPAIVVAPQNALKAVRAAQLIGSIVPPLQFEAELLKFDLSEVQKLKDQKQQRTVELRETLAELSVEKEEMSRLIEQKRQLSADQAQQLDAVQSRIAEIVSQAKSVEELVEKVEREIKLKQKIAKAMEEDQSLAPLPNLGDPNRTSPAVPFAQMKGKLPLPVRGSILANYGDVDPTFGKLTGVQIATHSNATVISPSDGWISYAGPYRRYGQVIIVNTGDNHFILLAGLEAINVTTGAFVLAGEPVGRMGSKQFVSAASLSADKSTPVLYTELRKGDKPFNPDSWWVNQS